MKAGYIRCSTNKQDLESQENLLKNWAAKNNEEIKIYRDFAISGKTTEREGITQLLQAADKKEIDGVVVVELSRIGRSVGFIHTTIEKLNKMGIKVILAQTNTELNSSSVEGVALLGGLALAAAVELKLIEERNRRGREKIKRENIKVGRKRAEDKNINLNAVLELKKSGKSMRETARLLNTSAPTIMRMLRRYEDGHKSNVTQSIQNDTKTAQNLGSVS